MSLAAALMLGTAGMALAEAKTLQGGQDVDMVLLPKFLGILILTAVTVDQIIGRRLLALRIRREKRVREGGG